MSQSGPCTFGQLSVRPGPVQPTRKESPVCACRLHRILPVSMSSAIAASEVAAAG